MKGVTIYRLAAEGFLVKNLDELARTIFSMRSANEGSRSLVASQSNGFLAFSDHEALWSVKGSLPTANEAEQLATQFLTTANRAFMLNVEDSTTVRGIFPNEPTLLGTYMVTRPQSNTANHWVCQFGVELPLDVSGARAPVMGALIEVRIGTEGQTIGLTSRWRPVRAEEIVGFQPLEENSDAKKSDDPADIAKSRIRVPELPQPPQSSHTTDQSQEPDPFLLYLLADDSSPQTILAPYYAIIDGHDGMFAPATQYSLLVEIGLTDEGTLRGIVVGGSGDYAHHWLSWPLDAFGGDPIDLGSAPEIRLGPGAHNVILQVKDRVTGAVAQSEAAIYGKNNKNMSSQ